MIIALLLVMFVAIILGMGLPTPVAMAAYAVCSISGGKFLETAYNAVKLGIVAFIVPFIKPHKTPDSCLEM